MVVQVLEPCDELGTCRKVLSFQSGFVCFLVLSRLHRMYPMARAACDMLGTCTASLVFPEWFCLLSCFV